MLSRKIQLQDNSMCNTILRIIL